MNDYGDWGVGQVNPPSPRTMTRRYTDAENTGAPVVPMLSGRTSDAQDDVEEQILSHRAQHV